MSYKKLSEQKKALIWKLYTDHNMSIEEIELLEHITVHNIKKTISEYQRKCRIGFNPVHCDVTGDPLLEIHDGKITALEDCTVSINGSKITAIKKGESVKISKET